jgi:hypothetical protein
MNLPRSHQSIRISQPDVGPFVIGEIEIVSAERILHPVRHPDQQRALNILTDAEVNCRRDDRRIHEPHNAHLNFLRVTGP